MKKLNLDLWIKKHGSLEEQSIYNLNKILKKRRQYGIEKTDILCNKIKYIIKKKRKENEEFLYKLGNSGVFKLGLTRLKQKGKVPITKIGDMDLITVTDKLLFKACYEGFKARKMISDKDEYTQNEFNRLNKANQDDTRFTRI